MGYASVTPSRRKFPSLPISPAIPIFRCSLPFRAALPGFIADNRARVHVAIGCTGGKHRSVYIANALKVLMAPTARVLRHDREHPTPE